MSSRSQKVPEAQTQPIPESSSNPASDKGAARTLEYITQHVYAAVAARHGVTASRFPWPRIGGSREKKKTYFLFFFSSIFPSPASLRPCLSAISLSGIFCSSDLDFLYTASAASPEILRPCLPDSLRIRDQAQSHWPATMTGLVPLPWSPLLKPKRLQSTPSIRLAWEHDGPGFKSLALCACINKGHLARVLLIFSA